MSGCWARQAPANNMPATASVFQTKSTLRLNSVPSIQENLSEPRVLSWLRLRFSGFLLLLFGFAGSIFFFHTNDAAVNRADLNFGDVFLPDGANVKRVDKLAVFVL